MDVLDLMMDRLNELAALVEAKEDNDDGGTRRSTSGTVRDGPRHLEARQPLLLFYLLPY